MWFTLAEAGKMVCVSTISMMCALSHVCYPIMMLQGTCASQTFWQNVSFKKKKKKRKSLVSLMLDFPSELNVTIAFGLGVS